MAIKTKSKISERDNTVHGMSFNIERKFIQNYKRLLLENKMC